MEPRKPSKRNRLTQLLAESRYARIAEAEWGELIRETGVSEGYLRRILRELAVPMSVLVEGVRQDDLAELERTLLALEAEYRDVDRQGKQACRAQVISARDRARFVARSAKTPPEKRTLKEEMILWMQTWLENPGAFPQWVVLRKRLIASRSTPL